MKKIIIILMLGLLPLLFVLFFLFNTNDNKITHDKSTSTEVSSDEYSPPTEQEKKSGDLIKTQIDSQPKENNDNPQDQLKKEQKELANIIIVDASQYANEVEIRFFVNKIIEGGSCKVTLSLNDSHIVKELTATTDATTTLCSTLVLPTSELKSTGEWSVLVEYENNTHYGSARATLTVGEY